MLDLCPLLPVTSHWQSPCPGIQAAEMSALGWGGGGWGRGHGVTGSWRTPWKSEPNGQLFFQGRGFFVSTLGLRASLWWLCLVFPGKSFVPRLTACFQVLSPLTAPFPTPAGSCGWISVSLEKECFITLLQASRFLSKSWKREVSVT